MNTVSNIVAPTIAIDLVAEELSPSLLSKKVDTDPLADERRKKLPKQH
jgi:hypothetical protein